MRVPAVLSWPGVLEPGRVEENLHAVDLYPTLLGLAVQRELPVFVCLTMRSDFIGDCDQFGGLPEAMRRQAYGTGHALRGAYPLYSRVHAPAGEPARGDD